MENVKFLNNLNPSSTSTNPKHLKYEGKELFKYRNSYFTPYKKSRLQQFFSSTNYLFKNQETRKFHN